MGEKSKYRKNRRKKFREFQRVFSFEDVLEIVAEQTGSVTTEEADVELAAGTIDFNFKTLVMPEGNDFTFANMQKERTCTVYLQGPDDEDGEPTAQDYAFPDYVDWEGGEEPDWKSSTAWLLEFVVADVTEGAEQVVASVASFGAGATNTIGGILYETVGTTAFEVPNGVTAISVVTIGGGGAGEDAHDGCGGGGGALAYKNNIAVSPGDNITVTVGAGGTVSQTATRTNQAGGNGGDSFITINGTAMCVASGGKGGNASFPTETYGNAATFSQSDGGGKGGEILHKGGTRTGGSGAGGYSGNGGRSGATQYDASKSATAGTGGGGGGGEGANGAAANYITGGGGVGVYGQGANGAASTYNGSVVSKAGGGSGGEDGKLNAGNNNFPTGDGGKYGGGGGGANGSDMAGRGAQGAVRIIWGPDRVFPDTNTDKQGTEV